MPNLQENKNLNLKQWFKGTWRHEPKFDIFKPIFTTLLRSLSFITVRLRVIPRGRRNNDTCQLRQKATRIKRRTKTQGQSWVTALIVNTHTFFCVCVCDHEKTKNIQKDAFIHLYMNNIQCFGFFKLLRAMWSCDFVLPKSYFRMKNKIKKWNEKIS